MSWQAPKLSREERDRSAPYVAAIAYCMAGVVTWGPTGERLAPCGAPKIGPGKILAIPLCSAHYYAKTCPLHGIKRRLLHEVRVGLIAWAAARRGHASDLVRPVCPGCGCGAGTVCRIFFPGGEGECVPAGALVGHRVCSGCVSARYLSPGVAVMPNRQRLPPQLPPTRGAASIVGITTAGLEERRE